MLFAVAAAAAAVVVVLSAGAPRMAAAAQLQWTGNAGNPLWSSVANWDQARVPTAADDVIIALPFSRGSSVQITSPAVCGTLTVGGNDFTQRLQVQSSLTVSRTGHVTKNGVVQVLASPDLPLSAGGAFKVDGNGVLNITSGAIAGKGAFSVATTASLLFTTPASKQVRAALDVAGKVSLAATTLQVAEGATVSFNGGLAITAGDVQIIGSGGGAMVAKTLHVEQAASSLVLQTVNVTTDELALRGAQHTASVTGGSLAAGLLSTVKDSSLTLTTAARALVTLCQGAVHVGGGTLDVASANNTNSGAFTVDNGATLRISGAVALGSLALASGGKALAADGAKEARLTTPMLALASGAQLGPLASVVVMQATIDASGGNIGVSGGTKLAVKSLGVRSTAQLTLAGGASLTLGTVDQAAAFSLVAGSGGGKVSLSGDAAKSLWNVGAALSVGVELDAPGAFNISSNMAITATAQFSAASVVGADASAKLDMRGTGVVQSVTTATVSLAPSPQASVLSINSQQGTLELRSSGAIVGRTQVATLITNGNLLSLTDSVTVGNDFTHRSGDVVCVADKPCSVLVGGTFIVDGSGAKNLQNVNVSAGDITIGAGQTYITKAAQLTTKASGRRQ